MPFDKDPNEIGALWVKSGRKGEYMTGTIEGIGAVVLFRNEKKRSEKSPDWRVLKSQPREDRQPVGAVAGDEPPF